MAHGMTWEHMVDHMATGKLRRAIIAGLGLMISVWTCTEPFNTDVNVGDDPLLVLTTKTTSLPIYDTAFVDLSWAQLTIDDFARFEITRYFLNIPDTLINKTLIRNVLYDPKITTWQDTLIDDESVHYQLDVFTIDGLVGSSEIDLIIPLTTRLQIPGGGKEFEERARSKIVDVGDTLQLGPGLHMVSNLDLTDKPILIEGLGAAKDVRVGWYSPPPYSSGSARIPYFMWVSDAIIRNLTFTDGIALEGGAIMAFGNTKLKNCIFIDNTAILHHEISEAEGGALYLNDNVEVSNCIIVADTAQNYGGAIFIDLSANNVKIINTTIYGNIAYADSSAIYTPYVHAQFTIKNCIFAYNSGNPIHPSPTSLTGFDITYNILDASWIEFDATNISATPMFVDPENGDFHLANDSPGINQGDPDPAYDDPDGTRNDMGAYGGPYGDW
ncbi:right-handed parallel beta-helix repeat-containing protein [Candidatus Neomarinimicrobiota bacterium]